MSFRIEHKPECAIVCDRCGRKIGVSKPDDARHVRRMLVEGGWECDFQERTDVCRECVAALRNGNDNQTASELLIAELRGKAAALSARIDNLLQCCDIADEQGKPELTTAYIRGVVGAESAP